MGHKDRIRVSANKLYDFLATVVDMAHALGLLVVVENPRSSFSGLHGFGTNQGSNAIFSASGMRLWRRKAKVDCPSLEPSSVGSNFKMLSR